MALRAFRNKGGKITLPQPQSAVLGYPGRQHEKKIGYRSPNWISVPFNLSLTKKIGSQHKASSLNSVGFCFSVLPHFHVVFSANVVTLW